MLNLQSTEPAITKTNGYDTTPPHPPSKQFTFQQPTITETDESPSVSLQFTPQPSIQPPKPQLTIPEPSAPQPPTLRDHQHFEQTMSSPVVLRPESELPSSINSAEAAKHSKAKTKFNSLKLRSKVNFNKLSNNEVFSMLTSGSTSDALSKINASGTEVFNKLNISGNEVLSKFSVSGPIETSFSGFKGHKKLTIGAPEGFKVISHVAQTDNDFECQIPDEAESIKIKQVLSDIKKKNSNRGSVMSNESSGYVKSASEPRVSRLNPVIENKPVISSKPVETRRSSVRDSVMKFEQSTPIKPVEKTISVIQEESFDYLKVALEQRLPFMGNCLFYKTRISVINIKFVFKLDPASSNESTDSEWDV